MKYDKLVGSLISYMDYSKENIGWNHAVILEVKLISNIAIELILSNDKNLIMYIHDNMLVYPNIYFINNDNYYLTNLKPMKL